MQYHFMEYESVSSLQNPRVKNLVRLRDGHHRRRQGLFLIEGKRELDRALNAEVELAEIFFAPEFFRAEEDQKVVERAVEAGAEACRLSKEAFAKCSYRQGPDGLLAIAPQWKRDLTNINFKTSPFLLVVEKVEKPGNLGTLMRTADAAGVDAVIVTDPITDIFNPNVIRASQGAVFNLTTVVSDNDTTLNWLKNNEITIVSTTPAATDDYWQADLAGAVAMVLGSEKDGLSDSWLDAATVKMKIPMAGRSDSLNVSAAAAIVLFEVVRQRSR